MRYELGRAPGLAHDSGGHRRRCGRHLRDGGGTGCAGLRVCAISRVLIERTTFALIFVALAIVALRRDRSRTAAILLAVCVVIVVAVGVWYLTRTGPMFVSTGGL